MSEYVPELEWPSDSVPVACATVWISFWVYIVECRIVSQSLKDHPIPYLLLCVTIVGHQTHCFMRPTTALRSHCHFFSFFHLMLFTRRAIVWLKLKIRHSTYGASQPKPIVGRQRCVWQQRRLTTIDFKGKLTTPIVHIPQLVAVLSQPAPAWCQYSQMAGPHNRGIKLSCIIPNFGILHQDVPAVKQSHRVAWNHINSKNTLDDCICSARCLWYRNI